MKNLTEAIYNRRSIRSYSNKQISEDLLKQIFDTARWAPSSMNEQPWLYLYAYNGTEKFKKILDSLAPFNQQWAKNASVLVLSMAKKTFEYKGKENRYYMYDVGSANQNLLLAAYANNIQGHPMGGFETKKIIESFNIPDNIEPVCIISLGYADSPDKLPQDLKERELAERKRKPLNEIIVDSF
jgi:nitroreductase